MKKIYTFALCLGLLNVAQAQDLLVEDFEGMNIGAVSTSVNGTTPGQGGYYTLAPVGTPNNDFLILNVGGTRGKVLQITGGVSSDRYMWNDSFATAWASREQGNDIVEVTYEFLTGSASNSRNTFGVTLFDQTTDVIIAGFQFNFDTKEILGLGRYLENGVPTNYSFKLGQTAGSAMILPNTTWVTVGFSYNKTTGLLRFIGPGFNKFVNSTTIGIDPGELDFYMSYENNNTVAAQGRMNNVHAKAVEVNGLLNVDTPPSSAEFAVYPNPVQDIVHLHSATGRNIEAAVLYDMLGRQVGQWEFNQAVEQSLDLSYLQPGHYMLQLHSQGATTTQQLLKQ